MAAGIQPSVSAYLAIRDCKTAFFLSISLDFLLQAELVKYALRLTSYD